MRARFLAVIRLAGPDAGAAEQPDCAAATVEPLPVLVRGDRLTVSSNFGMAGPDTAGEAVVGELFGRGSTQPAHALTETEWTGIRQSRGLAFVERYWGAYVAFIVGDGEVSIVRAPLGDVGCYYARSGDMLIVASDLALLLAASGRARRISMPALARHIAYPEWRSGETCIDGVGELRGGDRLTVSAAGMRCETLWSPWAFVVDERMIDDSDEAARAISNAVHLGVRARAARLDRTLLLLSGGLDSAIVAASLARIGADFVCLNLVGDDPASDEQHYAGLVADSVGARLLTRRFELERIDVRRSGAAHMPYPVHRCFTQAQDSVAMEVTNEEGAQAILDGGGGDNVFFASRTVTILADCLIAGGFDRRFWAATRALGDLGQTGMLALARKAAYRAWCRSRAPRRAAGTAFLTRAARAAVAEGAPHPWFLPPPRILPGRASHAALLVPAQNLAEAINAQAPTQAISPLITQPVAEACLRVPSWLWLAPGQDRAAARHAFQSALPQAIVHRRSKGTPTSFVATIFDRNRPAIRDMLLGGRLAALEILDVNAVERALDIAGPVRDLRFVRIMELVDAEAWASAQG